MSLWGAALLLLLGACAPENSCGPVDQRASYMPKLETVPTDVVVDPEFSPSELRKISAAVGTWNSFGSDIIHSQFYNAHLSDGSRFPLKAKSFDPTACEREGLHDKALYVVREKSESHWNSMSLAPNALAVTQRCINGSDLINQVMIVNSNRISSQQFQSVVLHELGHGLGLNHSCTDSLGKTDYRGCATLNDSHPYRMALMFPQIDSFKPVEEIRDNDRERTGCLYPQ